MDDKKDIVGERDRPLKCLGDDWKPPVGSRLLSPELTKLVGLSGSSTLIPEKMTQK